MTTEDAMDLQGKRVVVTIRDHDTYAHGCAAALDGKHGTVERANTRGDAWLVNFDEPAPTWWTHQTPANAFWFPANDLKVQG
jgi:hypothetical protein